MANAYEENIFKKGNATKKAEEPAHRVITDQESAEREAKTAKLRELRLQREAEQPQPAPTRKS